MDSSPSRTGPPRAPLAFRVGIVGHRPDRLKSADLDALGRAIRELLDAVKREVVAVGAARAKLFDGAPPVLRAVSPLAEGSDRIFVEQALALGFELCCVLPFPRAEFERDFVAPKSLEDGSLARFGRLLTQAKTVFELDGIRADEVRAYGTGGRVVLNQSDLLLLVWDGRREGKLGGTEETMAEAQRRGVPVAWIDAKAPHAWQMIHPGEALPPDGGAQGARPAPGSTIEDLKAVVRDLLALPSPEPGPTDSKKPCGDEEHARGEPLDHLEDFHRERHPSWSCAIVWKAFRDVVAKKKWPSVSFRVECFDDAVRSEWPDDPGSAIGRLVAWLRRYYAWSDGLAILYAARYRSAFISAFLLAAVAVGMALLPVAANCDPHAPFEVCCNVLELIAIVLILLLVGFGTSKRWHERWVEYRLIAELQRHLRLVAPLGGARPFPQVAAHLATYGQPSTSWMGWYVRCVERAIGLPTAVVDRRHVDEALGQLLAEVERQVEFHAGATNNAHCIEVRLHHTGMGLLYATLAFCALHILWPWHEWEHGPLILTFFCGFLPALGAALAGILNQGEFRRIAKRSESMRQQLQRLLGPIRKLRERIATGKPASSQDSVEALALADEAARLMVMEVLDWRLLILDQPLRPPA